MLRHLNSAEDPEFSWNPQTGFTLVSTQQPRPRVALEEARTKAACHRKLHRGVLLGREFHNYLRAGQSFHFHAKRAGIAHRLQVPPAIVLLAVAGLLRPPWRRMATVFEPISPAPPITTIFIVQPSFLLTKLTNRLSVLFTRSG